MMLGNFGPRAGVFLLTVAQNFRRPENLAFLPALTLGAFWLGGERGLILTALGLPLLFLLSGAFKLRDEPGQGDGRDGNTGLLMRTGLTRALDAILATCATSGRTTACLVLHVDDGQVLLDRHGHAAHTEVMRRTAERLQDMLRAGDLVARLEGDSFAVALSAVARADLESMLQLGARLQAAVAEPVAVDAARLHITVSAGLCLASRLFDTGSLPDIAVPGALSHDTRGAQLLAAAETAAEDARANGPGALRAWTPAMQRARADRNILRGEVEAALDSGQIVAHFQPQVSTDTGAISGFEALARWQHPERGLVAPCDFLPLVAQSGLSERLGEVMVFQALQALSGWDAAGLTIPSVAVNFSQDELGNPRLPEKLKWELDRFGLAPERLTVEILETVVAGTGNDVVVRNVAELSRMGCGIDLDDFGTGHASIANIRRFAVRRLKIDRSFVMGLDADSDQRRMVAAILSMADRLGLETLAEGVETTGEHAMLAQLGCGHVQGFGIARPMPLADTAAWVQRHDAHCAAAPRIGKRAG